MLNRDRPPKPALAKPILRPASLLDRPFCRKEQYEIWPQSGCVLFSSSQKLYESTKLDA
jgi:hypothetical protein